MIVEMKNLNFGYNKENYVLKNIQLSIQPKDRLIIVGDPAAGKTSLLNLIRLKNFYEKKYYISGSLEIDPKKRIVQIFEELHLLQDWNVMDYLSMSIDQAFYSNEKVFYSNMNDLIKFFQLKNIQDKKISELNLGSKQLVSVIMSVLSRPDLLLADAPFSNLDIKLAQKVIECFEYYQKLFNMSWIITTPYIDSSIKIKANRMQLTKGTLICQNLYSTQENYYF